MARWAKPNKLLNAPYMTSNRASWQIHRPCYIYLSSRAHIWFANSHVAQTKRHAAAKRNSLASYLNWMDDMQFYLVFNSVMQIATSHTNSSMWKIWKVSRVLINANHNLNLLFFFSRILRTTRSIFWLLSFKWSFRSHPRHRGYHFANFVSEYVR